MDKGNWREQKDSKEAEACRRFLNTSCDAIPAIVAEFTEAVPDQEGFAKKVVEELKSGKAHTTYNLYNPFESSDQQ